MTDNSGVFLSILIPTWNRYESVLDAVKSVTPVTDKIEIIVSDDGSDESIARRLQDGLKSFPNVKLFRNAANLGMVGNWNACMSHATGEWIGLLCDDDCYCEGAMERAVSLMKSISRPSLIIQDPSLSVDMLYFEKGQETVRALGYPILSGNFWHRKIIETLGGFNEWFIYSADTEYWHRIACHFPVIKVKKHFAIYKQHENNYMWATWRKPDFLEQLEVLARAVVSYRYDDDETIEKEVDLDVWGTLLAIIMNTFLKNGKKDIFLRYFPEALKRARGFKRKAGLVKALMVAVTSRFKVFLEY
jgi:glycosyltransferase involved in cell wall biosynthesis